MLPEWDFGGDPAKRRAFIEFAWTELDSFALMTSERFSVSNAPDAWLTDLAGVAQSDQRFRRSVGRPRKSDAERAATGMNAMAWDYALLRYMFGRYWPKRRRAVADPASAARIAVSRNRAAINRRLREHPTNSLIYVTNDRAAAADLAEKLVREYQTRSKGSIWRQAADADIAYLQSLPSYRFAR